MPLRDAIETGAEETYAFVRCAALFFSVTEYASEVGLGAATYQDLATTVNLHIAIATMARVNNGTSEEVAKKQILSEISNISDFYLEKFQENYAQQGQAFGADSEFQSDLTICNQITSEFAN